MGVERYLVMSTRVGNKRELAGPWDLARFGRYDRINTKVLFAIEESVNDFYHEYGRDYKGYSRTDAINTNCIDGPYFLKPMGAGVFWRNELWI